MNEVLELLPTDIAFQPLVDGRPRITYSRQVLHVLNWSYLKVDALARAYWRSHKRCSSAELQNFVNHELNRAILQHNVLVEDYRKKKLDYDYAVACQEALARRRQHASFSESFSDWLKGY